MRDIKIQTVNVREIKKIVETERQITGSKRTERGGLNCHMTELLGRPSITLKPHDLYLLCRRELWGKDDETDKERDFCFARAALGFQLRFRIVYMKGSSLGYRLKE